MTIPPPVSLGPSGFVGSWLALSLFNAPYVFLLAAVALRRMDRSLEEAARGLGLNPWQVFARVVLPQLRPTLAASALHDRRLRGRVLHGLRHVHEGDLLPVPDR